MDQFQVGFINEAKELMVELESALLVLEDDIENLEQIESVFRVMHTLKGAANMFGFENIGLLTHDLETIYDKVRNGEGEVNKQVLDVSLKTLDFINGILDSPEDQNEDDFNVLLKEIQVISRPGEVSSADTQTTTSVAKTVITSYHVKFVPNLDLMATGTNPFFLVEDLIALGDTQIRCNLSKVPVLDELTPLDCFASWEVLLVSESSEEDIKDVFIFVEDECTLEINKISQSDILNNSEVTDYLKELEGDEFDWQKIKEIHTSSQKSKKKVKTNTKKEATIRINADKIDELMNLVSQLVTTQASLALYADNNKTPELELISENVQKLARQLRDSAFSMSLIPMDTIFVRFKRLVRDISSGLGKEVDFIIEGGDTELDKTVIERIADPLMHILRNSMDHGIEDAKSRKASGKPLVGTVNLRAYYSGASVHIEVQDDGKGINPDIILNKAIEKGIVSSDAKLTNKEIYNLLFASGFSTAEQVTDISGRGVGMDVVKQNITDLRGEIIIDSELGKGSIFTLKLPLTLSIIDGLLVDVGGSKYVLPLDVIGKCHEIDAKDIEDNFNRLLLIDNEQVPFLNLRDEFGLSKTKKDLLETIIVKNNQREVGLIVDEIIGEIQAVIKPLGEYYRNQDIFSGTTILGDGTVALVLDSNRMVQNYIKQRVA